MLDYIEIYIDAFLDLNILACPGAGCWRMDAGLNQGGRLMGRRAGAGKEALLGLDLRILH
jgi:hypothetical protein